jgi:hypothetical protein
VETATAIAVSAPNAVAATVVLAGWLELATVLEAQRRWPNAGFDHRRRLADLDHVRMVIDLHRVAYPLDSVRFRPEPVRRRPPREPERRRGIHTTAS